MPKDQARKSRDSKRRRWWIIRSVTGEEYEAFVREKCDAIAYARVRGIKVKAVYSGKEAGR